MTTELHRKHHEILDKMLNEVVRDFLEETKTNPINRTLSELLAWSHKQTLPDKTVDTIEPNEGENSCK
jgi:hypothetical protein